MDLSNSRPVEGAVHSDSSRRDRGYGSGDGKTTGKGHKGQKACSGALRPGFEGGQMLLYRRLPKRGFRNHNTKDIMTVNVERLEKFENGNEAMAGSLIALGAISHARDGVKILGNGEPAKKLTVKVNAVSEDAKTETEATGGTCEVS